MFEVVRFGVSLPKELLMDFDKLIKDKGYTNRSEALRDLIREELIRKEWEKGEGEVAGAITLVYDHHQRELVDKIIDTQHDFQEVIVSTQHIHLDHDNCLEIVAVKGKKVDIIKLYNFLRAIKGVKHTTLNATTTGKKLK